MKRKISVKKLVLLALMSALSITLKMTVPILFGGTIRWGFDKIPIIFSGIAFGPLAGGIVGAVSDLGGLLSLKGSYFPGITLSYILIGVIPGLVMLYFKRKDLKTIIISNAFVYLFIYLLLTTYWLSIMYGKAFIVYLPGRVVSEGILTVISIIVVQLLIKISVKLNIIKP